MLQKVSKHPAISEEGDEKESEEDEDIKDDVDVSDAASMSEVHQLLEPGASSLLLKGVTDRYFCN
jgi:hypothetical protein